MGFLSKIFKPKPGGTLIGNMIRGVASKFSGGVLGGGSMLRAQEQANGWRDANGNLTPAGYQALNEGKMAPEVSNAVAGGVINGAAVTPAVQDGAVTFSMTKLKEWFPWILVVVAFLVWLFFRNKNKSAVNVQTNSFGSGSSPRRASASRKTYRKKTY